MSRQNSFNCCPCKFEEPRRIYYIVNTVPQALHPVIYKLIIARRTMKTPPGSDAVPDRPSYHADGNDGIRLSAVRAIHQSRVLAERAKEVEVERPDEAEAKGFQLYIKVVFHSHHFAKPVTLAENWKQIQCDAAKHAMLSTSLRPDTVSSASQIRARTGMKV